MEKTHLIDTININLWDMAVYQIMIDSQYWPKKFSVSNVHN